MSWFMNIHGSFVCPNCGMRPIGVYDFGPPCRCTPEERNEARYARHVGLVVSPVKIDSDGIPSSGNTEGAKSPEEK
jgi:hypothetical protein